MVVTRKPGLFSRGDSRVLLLLAFASIYIIWGSTYLAIRYAVETIPPLITAGARHLGAGAVLMAWALARGYRPDRRELRSSLVLGILFFFIGHGTLHWAEQIVPSGLAALLVATEAMWVALLGAVFFRQKLNLANLVGLVLGLVGVMLLTIGQGTSAQSASLLGVIVILLGTVSWSLGMLYSTRATLPSDPLARAAMPLLVGAVLLLTTAGFTGEFRGLQVANVTAKSALGLLYLIVFGSIVAFTAYTWLLERVAPNVIVTHTYVNPVVAVWLGWAWAGEAMSPRTTLAAILVVVAVILMSFNTSEESAQEARGEQSEEAA